jgi:hypothetical protein
LKEERPSAFQVFPQWIRALDSVPAFYRNDGDERKKQKPDHPARLLDTSHACIATFSLSSRAIAASLNPRSNARETFSVCLTNI